uniref:Integrase catalytic domain-containing protein n=1 Tax=Photinus pyralis TaxID=7054 RepID=A0A1Y1N5I8_PHOPY
MESIYYDPSHPAGFGGVSSLSSALKNRYSTEDVKAWLQKQEAYTVHKPVKRKFQRNKYIVNNMFELWQADLCDMRSLAKNNRGYNYILTVIDVFSKKAWARPLKQKTANSIIEAFSSIFEECDNTPENIQTDKGKEFVAASVQQFFKKYNINYYVTHNPDVKACIIERLNRTLKTKMHRYFTYKNTFKYVDVLQDLVSAYNKSYHSSIKMAPDDVNEENILKVWQNLYAKGFGKETRPIYKVGQHVRITRTKYHFEKGYESNFSQEVFKIIKVIKRRPPVYRIVDLSGEDIEGTFYEEELQAVTIDEDTVFKIDEILEEKGRGKNKKYLVKWRGYSDKFNSWISAAELKNI